MIRNFSNIANLIATAQPNKVRWHITSGSEDKSSTCKCCSPLPCCRGIIPACRRTCTALCYDQCDCCLDMNPSQHCQTCNSQPCNKIRWCVSKTCRNAGGRCEDTCTLVNFGFAAGCKTCKCPVCGTKCSTCGATPCMCPGGACLALTCEFCQAKQTGAAHTRCRCDRTKEVIVECNLTVHHNTPCPNNGECSCHIRGISVGTVACTTCECRRCGRAARNPILPDLNSCPPFLGIQALLEVPPDAAQPCTCQPAPAPPQWAPSTATNGCCLGARKACMEKQPTAIKCLFTFYKTFRCQECKDFQMERQCNTCLKPGFGQAVPAPTPRPIGRAICITCSDPIIDPPNPNSTCRTCLCRSCKGISVCKDCDPDNFCQYCEKPRIEQTCYLCRCSTCKGIKNPTCDCWLKAFPTLAQPIIPALVTDEGKSRSADRIAAAMTYIPKYNGSNTHLFIQGVLTATQICCLSNTEAARAAKAAIVKDSPAYQLLIDEAKIAENNPPSVRPDLSCWSHQPARIEYRGIGSDGKPIPYEIPAVTYALIDIFKAHFGYKPLVDEKWRLVIQKSIQPTNQPITPWAANLRSAIIAWVDAKNADAKVPFTKHQWAKQVDETFLTKVWVVMTAPFRTCLRFDKESVRFVRAGALNEDHKRPWHSLEDFLKETSSTVLVIFKQLEADPTTRRKLVAAGINFAAELPQKAAATRPFDTRSPSSVALLRRNTKETRCSFCGIKNHTREQCWRLKKIKDEGGNPGFRCQGYPLKTAAEKRKEGSFAPEPPPVALIRKSETSVKKQPDKIQHQDIEELIRRQVATHVDLIRASPTQQESDPLPQPIVAAAKQRKKKPQKVPKKRAAPIKTNQRAYKNQTISHVWAAPESPTWQQQ